MGLTEKKVEVSMPGGTLSVETDADYNIRMTGSVGYIGEITLAEDFFA